MRTQRVRLRGSRAWRANPKATACDRPRGVQTIIETPPIARRWMGHPANILGDATKCILVCGLCYVTAFIAQSVRLENISAFTAWIPIFVFRTLAMVLFDRVRT